jgi:ABC-type transport system substrate-binding protein
VISWRASVSHSTSSAIPSDNWQHASIPELDSLLEQWLRADAGELLGAASGVQSIIAQELPYIPLVTPNDIWVNRPELSGYLPYQATLYPLYQPVRLGGRPGEGRR